MNRYGSKLSKVLTSDDIVRLYNEKHLELLNEEKGTTNWRLHYHSLSILESLIFVLIEKYEKLKLETSPFGEVGIILRNKQLRLESAIMEY